MSLTFLTSITIYLIINALSDNDNDNDNKYDLLNINFIQ